MKHSNKVFQAMLFKTVVFEKLLSDYKVETLRCERDLTQKKLQSILPEGNAKEKHIKKKTMSDSLADYNDRIKKAKDGNQRYINDLKKANGKRNIKRMINRSSDLFNDFANCVIKSLEHDKNDTSVLVACCLESCKEDEAMVRINGDSYIAYCEKATPFDYEEEDD